MAVQVRRLTGAGPTATDITGINTRANAEDAHSTAGTSNPILVPADGTNYSYWVTTGLYYDGSGTGTIDNIEWFSDASDQGTGVGIIGNTADTYVQATGTAGTSGTQLTTGNHAGLTAAPVSVFTFTTGDPKEVAGDVTDPEDEEFGDYFVYQFTVADTAGAGASGEQTFTWRYDTTISE
jgi:hypothetical protein